MNALQSFSGSLSAAKCRAHTIAREMRMLMPDCTIDVRITKACDVRSTYHEPEWARRVNWEGIVVDEITGKVLGRL